MNLDHLQVFCTAAYKKTFSETARSLHLSQPSVSLQIQHLEEAVGARLFERTTKNIKLTDAGRLLLTYAEQILQLVNQSKRELALLCESIHGDLHIGASLTIGEYILPYLLGNFQRQYPKINLLMKTQNSQEIIRQLLSNEIHLGFIEANITHPSLEFHPFQEDELVVIVSVKNPLPLLAKKEKITLKELFPLPFIVREQGSGTRLVMEESLRQNGVNPDALNIILELGNTESIKAIVESGAGVSIISRAAIRKEIQLETLRAIKIQGISLIRNFYVVSVKNKILSFPAESFSKFVLQHYKALSTENPLL